eukprot:TRINITY_DN4072_c3_g1_i1.p1 TRINITY_DN4072_c3_g1~~TRINITY_DN4072_c3_g1_i1.p1  ORF type:complete len:312 (-),score=30.90 TRINITY_DN4072_c3_g1_i1:158-1051(-)
MAGLTGTQGSSGSYGGPGPSGYEPPYAQSQGGGGGGSGSLAAVSQLFARLSQEIEEQKPKNCIHFMVDFLCKHYPEHLHGFASIWQMDPDLERERHEVVNFFKAHKISTAVAAHFTNAGFDTLDTLTTLSPDSLVDVEAFNNVKWLPGHKVRLQQIFGEISARVRAYRQQYGHSSPHHHHRHHHHHSRHHGSGYNRSISPPAHRTLPATSYTPPLAISNVAAPATHHVTTHVHPPVHVSSAVSNAPHVAYTGGFSQVGLGHGVSAGHTAYTGSALTSSPNPSNNIFLQNLPGPSPFN